MTSLLAGLLVLIVAVTVLRWFARVDVKTARKAINWGVLGLIVLLILFLAATGRIGAAIAGLVAMSAWIMRILSVVQMGRQFSGMFRSFRFGQGGGAASAGQTSEVDSVFLRMSLDHSTGDMDGEVKQGACRGQRLKSMDRQALLALLQEIQSDPDSVGLLEAYLDRAHPEWRETETASAGPPPQQSAMGTDEALRILGLKEGAGEADIKTAYRRLMAQLHPDKGGSDYLAAKVNQAKDLLLKKRA
jgi:hypothetical protein